MVSSVQQVTGLFVLGCAAILVCLMGTTSGASVDELCSASKIEAAMAKGAALTSTEAQVLFDECGTKFVADNKISESVKQAIDTWMGLDVSKANGDQIFWLHKLALLSEKPTDLDEQFKSDCKQMNKQYNEFRDKTAPLSQILDAKSMPWTTDDEQKFLAYVLYAQFCSVLL